MDIKVIKKFTIRRDTPLEVASSIVKETAKKIAKLYPH